jgi:hypothetical protein
MLPILFQENYIIIYLIYLILLIFIQVLINRMVKL